MKFELKDVVLSNNAGDSEGEYYGRFILHPLMDSEGAYLYVEDREDEILVGRRVRLTSVEQAERCIKEECNLPAKTDLGLPGKGRYGLRLIEVPMKILGTWKTVARLTPYDRKTGKIAEDLIEIGGTTSRIFFKDSDQAYDWLEDYYKCSQEKGE